MGKHGSIQLEAPSLLVKAEEAGDEDIEGGGRVVSGVIGIWGW